MTEKINLHDHCFYVESLSLLNDPFAESSPPEGIHTHSMAVEDQSRATFPENCEYQPVASMAPKGKMDITCEYDR